MQLVLRSAGDAAGSDEHHDDPDPVSEPGPIPCPAPAAPPSSAASRPTSAPTAPLRARRCTAPPTRGRRSRPTTAASQVHSCHGRARQVEVLRDAILHALDEDETLEPRDVIVMCPDVESFAPLIQATFGAGERAGETEPGAPEPEGAGTDLRVRLADRSLTQTNPVLTVVVPAARAGRPAADRLAGARPRRPRARAPALRARRRRPHAAAGLDLAVGHPLGTRRPHRAPYKLDAVPEGTWSAGLDRLLLGVTMTEDGQRLFADVLPLDDVDSRSIELAGRLAELIARLRPRSTRCRPTSRWPSGPTRSRGAADALTATSGRDRWQRAELQRILDEMVARGRRARARPARARRGPRATRRAARGPPDAGQLPHRPPDGLHADADALGPPPGRLPARARRRRLPAQGAARRR